MRQLLFWVAKEDAEFGEHGKIQPAVKATSHLLTGTKLEGPRNSVGHNRTKGFQQKLPVTI